MQLSQELINDGTIDFKKSIFCLKTLNGLHRQAENLLRFYTKAIHCLAVFSLACWLAFKQVMGCLVLRCGGQFAYAIQ